MNNINQQRSPLSTIGIISAIIIAIILIIVSATWIQQRMSLMESESDALLNSLPASYAVQYKVTGEDEKARILVDLTFEGDASGVQSQSAHTPWLRTYRMNEGDFYHVSAQLPDGESATVQCEVRIRGEVVDVATTVGPSARAHCSGFVELEGG